MSQEEIKLEVMKEEQQTKVNNHFERDDEDDDNDEDDEEEEGYSFNQDKRKNNIMIAHKNIEEVEEYFEKMIDRTIEKEGIPFGRALMLLSRNSYDETKLQVITDEKLLDLIYLNPPQSILDMSNLTSCLLCFDDLTEENKYGLSCNHFFCKDCFSLYIQEVFKEGQFCIFKTCPLDGCLERLGRDDFKQFLDDEKFKVYKKFLVKDAFGNSEIVLSCPQPNCPYVQMGIKNEMIKLTQQNIICQCQHEYCNQCKEIGHFPCNCSDFRKWISKMEGQGNQSNLNDEWFILNTKPCPKCKIFIEKNQGCMHMTCKQCNHHFCWICLGDWKGHNDYYNCSKFDKDKLDQLQREKIELSHFKFHQGRYNEHLSNISVVKKETESIINSLQEINQKLISQSQKPIDTDQIIKYCQQILRGRKYLPFFYAKGFFIEQPKLKFFNDLIEDYVKIIEDFNSSLENLKDITEKNPDKKSKIVIKNSFYQFKDTLSKKLGTCTNYIDQKLKQFTEDLDNFENIANQKLKLLPVKSEAIFKKKQDKLDEKKKEQQQQQQQSQQLKLANEQQAKEEKKVSFIEKIDSVETTKLADQTQPQELLKKRKVQFNEEIVEENISLGDSTRKQILSIEKLDEIPTSKKENNSQDSITSKSQSVLIYRCISENAPLTCIDCGENPATNEYGVCDDCFNTLNN